MNIDKLTDAEFLDLLAAMDRDGSGRLSRMDPAALMQLFPHQLQLHVSDASVNQELLPRPATRSDSTSRAPRGIRFNVIRKGNHPDGNWGRFGIHGGGAANYHYSYGHDVTGLGWANGDNNCYGEVWCPTYAGYPFITYFTRIELDFDHAIWKPGGVAWWGEVWGNYKFTTEKKLAGWDLKVRLTW